MTTSIDTGIRAGQLVPHADDIHTGPKPPIHTTTSDGVTLCGRSGMSVFEELPWPPTFWMATCEERDRLSEG